MTKDEALKLSIAALELRLNGKSTSAEYTAKLSLEAMIACKQAKSAPDDRRTVELTKSEELDEAIRIAHEYTLADSQIDSGNLYHALRICLDLLGANEASFKDLGHE